MSLLEWFLEPTNPGPVGDIEINAPEPDDEEPPKKWVVWLTIGFGWLILGIGLYGVFYDLFYARTGQIIFKFLALAVYVLLSYWITPRPDYTNVGWLGGLLDNPFRISEDFNRRLIFLQAVLFPGKLMAYSLLMSYLVVKNFSKRRKK